MRRFWLPIASLVAATVASSFAPATAQPPSGIDAGLTMPFASPDPITGRVLDVRLFGATPNNASNNDSIAIQSAITAARPGDVVYLPNGVYHLQSTVNLKTAVSMVGQSRDSTVLAGAFGATPHAVVYAAPGVNNLTLSTFTITLGSGSVYNAGVRLGMENAAEVSRIAVKNLLVEKHQRFGIQLQNTKHVLVEGNVVRNASALDGGGSGYGIIIDQSGSHNNVVRNNHVGPVIRHGILIQESAHHNLIENNRIVGAVSGALDLHGEDEYSNEIRYNKISDCVRNGTSVSPNGGGIEVGEFSGVIGSETMHDNSGPNNWIHHNEVYNCTYGLRIVNNSNYTLIEDNNFYNNDISGIQADLAPLHHLYLLRNNVYQNGNGIVLSNVAHAVLQNNLIVYNRGYGVWADAGVTDYTFTGNTVTNNGVNIAVSTQQTAYSAPAGAPAAP